ncbi:MAG: sulfurtransferase complex subunit TusB [Chromatiales bacterium]|nr:sulfurtransferase complex subunit TusB [Chromatiales bacterium]
MAMLHIVNKSPFERNALSSCLETAQDGSSVLLIEDGVVGATIGGRLSDAISQAMERKLVFYVLTPDLKARGFLDNQVLEGIKLVGYEDFVDLVADHVNVQSWL